jgi:hypothetical protein
MARAIRGGMGGSIVNRPIGVGVALAVWLAAGIAAAGEVSCEGFVLGYDGPAKKKVCAAEDTSTGNLESQSKTLQVTDQTFSLFVSYDHTGMRTYIPSHPVEDLLRDSSFTHVQKWGVSRNIRGFQVIAFNGVGKGDDFELTCALFARYTGNPGNYEFDAGPGTRNAVIGVYCADPGFLTPAQQKEGFYGVIDGMIARLRLPPAD